MKARYLCAACGTLPSNPRGSTSSAIKSLMLVWQSSSSSRSGWARPQHGPIFISSCAWQYWEGTGSGWNWRAVAVPQGTDKWGQRLTFCFGQLAKRELSCVSSSDEMVRADVRCVPPESVKLGFIRPCSSPKSSYKACICILLCVLFVPWVPVAENWKHHPMQICKRMQKRQLLHSTFQLLILKLGNGEELSFYTVSP